MTPEVCKRVFIKVLGIAAGLVTIYGLLTEHFLIAFVGAVFTGLFFWGF